MMLVAVHIIMDSHILVISYNRAVHVGINFCEWKRFVTAKSNTIISTPQNYLPYDKHLSCAYLEQHGMLNDIHNIIT